MVDLPPEHTAITSECLKRFDDIKETVHNIDKNILEQKINQNTIKISLDVINRNLSKMNKMIIGNGDEGIVDKVRRLDDYCNELKEDKREEKKIRIKLMLQVWGLFLGTFGSILYAFISR